MAFEFYVNMQKRKDGKVYADLHKTDHTIYFTPEEAINKAMKEAANGIGVQK